MATSSERSIKRKEVSKNLVEKEARRLRPQSTLIRGLDLWMLVIDQADPRVLPTIFRVSKTLSNLVKQHKKKTSTTSTEIVEETVKKVGKVVDDHSPGVDLEPLPDLVLVSVSS